MLLGTKYQLLEYQLYNTTMQSQTESQLKQLSESAEEFEVGITYYISKGEPIPAVTKFMLTDFIVNEIAPNGEVVRLKQKPNFNINPVKKAVEQPVSYEISKQLAEQICSVLGKEAQQAIAQLYKRLDDGEKITQWQFTIQNMPDMSKEQRTKIHAFVRENLINIQSNTLDGNKMKLKLNKKMKKINPAVRNKYIHFVLFKSNIDTMGAIFKLSKLTYINQKLFSTAGLKDKRGVTTQLVSLYNTQLAVLQKFYTCASRNKQIWIADFKENMDSDIGVGDLFGNQFGLILRMINPSDCEKIGERVQSLKDNGMVNYFGMQRFGSCGTKTYMIGLKILRREWREVVEELLLQQTKDEQINQIKRDCYMNEQYAKAERALPNKCKIEKNLFKGFKKHGKNFQNVFESLPRSMKTLYLHSLQSYLWNRIVSRRLKQFGLAVCKGDLVGKKLSGFKLAKHEVQQQQQNKQQKEQNVESDDEAAGEEIADEQKYEVQLIDENNLPNYQITDVVFPLYGPSINLPKESLAYHYLMDEIKALNLTEEDFTQKGKKLCFKGMYRKMIIKPSNVSYSIISHCNAKDEVQTPFYINGQKLDVTPGPRRAVQVVIQLPKSSYATMALRQLLHISSSFESQMILNRLYEAQKTPETTQNP